MGVGQLGQNGSSANTRSSGDVCCGRSREIQRSTGPDRAVQASGCKCGKSGECGKCGVQDRVCGSLEHKIRGKGGAGLCHGDRWSIFFFVFLSIFYHLFVQVCVTETERVCEIRKQRLCQPTSRQECHTEQVISGVPQRTGFFLQWAGDLGKITRGSQSYKFQLS